MAFWLRIVLITVGGYLLGSINFARLYTQARNKDIGHEGSGNPGTMNMARNYGLKAGVATLLFDMFKGAAPALAGYFILRGYVNSAEIKNSIGFLDGPLSNIGRLGIFIGGGSAILGHMLPLFHKFRGGKGVATSIGLFYILDWRVILGLMAVCIVVFYFFELGSVVSFICIGGMTAAEYIKMFVRPLCGTGYYSYYNIFTEHSALDYRVYFIFSALILGTFFIVIMLAHYKNIYNLIRGRERRFSMRERIKAWRERKRAQDDSEQ